MKLEIPDIRRVTLELLTQIPKGKLTTYQALAMALGDTMATRAVGAIMAANEQIEKYPCYKVVHNDGRVGEYSGAGGSLEKMKRLQAEGIEVRDGYVPNLSKYLFKEFKCDKPLKKLQQLQDQLGERVSLESAVPEPKTAGGVDVSYAQRNFGPATAAYVKLDLASKKLLFSETLEQDVTFPYIPTYLAFREIPLLLALLQRLKESNKLADVTLVDGNGILHPRRAGIASHLGVLLDIPTIGITKSLLCGEVNLENIKPGEIRHVFLNGQKVGAAMKATERAQAIFVSPGHKIDLEDAIQITRACLTAQRLPEPIALAHNISKEASLVHKLSQRDKQMALEL